MRPSLGTYRDTGQRWLTWINEDTVACPPWAFFVITRSTVDDTGIRFYGRRNTADISPLSNAGVPWNGAFNSELAVEPGESGRWTVDLPTWCLIDDTAVLGGFVTYIPSPPLQQDWSLHPLPLLEVDLHPVIPDPIAATSHLWSGFPIFATRVIPEFKAIWNVREPSFLRGEFKLGFLGGLVTYLQDNIPEPTP